jgi:hypothetical protein
MTVMETKKLMHFEIGVYVMSFACDFVFQSFQMMWMWMLMWMLMLLLLLSIVENLL